MGVWGKWVKHAKYIYNIQDFNPEQVLYHLIVDYGIKVAEKDQHVRFHALKIDVDDKTIVDQAVIDFKHLFSVPMKYLHNHRLQRICTIEDIYIDQIVNKMAAYLARVGLPDPKIPER